MGAPDGLDFLHYHHYHHPLHHHHYPHLANMDFSQLLNNSILTRLEVSFSSPVSSACWSIAVYYPHQSITRHSVHMLQTASSVFLYFCLKLEFYLHLMPSLCLSCSLSQVCAAVFLIHLISSAVSFLFVSLNLMVQFSLPYDRSGWTSVLHGFILVFFIVSFCLNPLSILPLIFTLLSNSLSMSTLFHNISNFPKGERNLFLF